MTVIAAATDGTNVWMAADSGSEVADRVFRRAGSKVLRLQVGDSEALVGVAGRSVLRPLFDKVKIGGEPDPASDADCDAWAQAIAVAWTELAMELQPQPVDQGGSLDGCAILAFAGRLWYVTENEAERVGESFAACGSGASAALGAFHAVARQTGRSVAVDVQLAADAACRYSQGCYLPVVYESAGPGVRR